MSNSTFTSSSSSYIVSSSSSSSVNGNHQTGHRAVQQSHTGPDGQTTTTSASQNLGEPIVQETRSYDAQGRELLNGPMAGQSQGRIEDVSDDAAQAARDREYEERMEEEYAKREGGA